MGIINWNEDKEQVMAQQLMKFYVAVGIDFIFNIHNFLRPVDSKLCRSFLYLVLSLSYLFTQAKNGLERYIQKFSRLDGERPKQTSSVEAS